MSEANGNTLLVRDAEVGDLAAICTIYNQGIADRCATLDAEPKSDAEMAEWYHEHDARYRVLVGEREGQVVGWVSLRPYSHRCADRAVADGSVYVERSARGSGIGTALLRTIEAHARRHQFHKIVLFALAANTAGRRLYDASGYRTVGVFSEHGRLDGRFVDVLALEKILRPLVLFVCRHNTGRSQMAEAYLRAFAGDIVDVASAGTIAADRPDPGVVAAMADDGFDLRAAHPKLLDPGIVERAERIVTMGCDVEGIARVDDDWGLPDPKGQPPQRVREIRDLVKDRAKRLATQLREAAG